MVVCYGAYKLLERQRKHTDKLERNTRNNSSLMRPTCLVFEVSVLGTLNFKKQALGTV